MLENYKQFNDLINRVFEQSACRFFNGCPTIFDRLLFGSAILVQMISSPIDTIREFRRK